MSHRPFDEDTCRRAFQYYDSNHSGALDPAQALHLTEVLWSTFNPASPHLDDMTKEVIHDELGAATTLRYANDSKSLLFLYQVSLDTLHTSAWSTSFPSIAARRRRRGSNGS